MGNLAKEGRDEKREIGSGHEGRGKAGREKGRSVPVDSSRFASLRRFTISLIPSIVPFLIGQLIPP